MKVKTEPRQTTLSFKVTKEIAKMLTMIHLSMSEERGEVITKTDVVEAAIRSLAKKLLAK